ncbi:uncharacterized protein [Chaetodon trifascialis]|uniref:uncharacterized protein n=1 Tax=Chaetodon trifascialis TaxID=109706 RepID=UPI003992588A
MDLLDLGDCEDENCNLPPGFPENCLNQECMWDESVFGLTELVCVTIICILLMLFGLLGNILTILVVWLRPHMRSSTYLYLSSMAVSDLLILLLLPLDLYKLWRPWPWPFGELTCKLTMFLSECCTFCTILHITFLSLERYVAVCWPITAKTLVTRSRTRALIGCLWLGAAVSAAPVLVMVGVVEVGGEEPGVSQWREGGGWTGREGEKGGFMIGGREQGSGHITLMDGGLEGINWEEKHKKELSERIAELKWFGEKGERNLAIGEKDERMQGDQDGGEGEGKNEVEGERQNKMKEDEGGGREEGRYRGEADKRECRCTHYAISSGLLSAMTILSNLYFLVPFCILGLVYSLIGRTLWLRPQSSRREQSHRHTVKMLGVIVLAFVLCWLPFHVGRTIFSFTLGSDRQDANTDASSHLGVSTLPDINIHTVATPVSHSDSDMDVKTGKMSAQAHTEREETRCVTLDAEMGINCSTTPKTLDCLYDTASHAGLFPDASMDASLASLLSLNSSWALEQQYSTLQSGMTQQQRLAFNRDLFTLFRGNSTVSYGGVGVVALALSVLFEMLAHHQTTGLGSSSPEAHPPPPDPIHRMFGADTWSDISSIASEFLKQIPGAANDQHKMAALLESYERQLRSELTELYERMMLEERSALSSTGVKQWMNGAALHVHTFLHWKRLTSSSGGETLSLDYLHRVDPLLKIYRDYLPKMVKVFPASSPGPSGMLIVEPLRNVSHGIRFRVCERKAIQQTLAERFLSDQNLQTGKQFFQSSHKHHDALMAQLRHFQLSVV